MSKAMKKDDKFMGVVKVGPKGQIVIPKDIRDMFSIETGDNLLILADKKRGIAIERTGVFNKIADAIFNGRAQEIYPENSADDSKVFAENIKKLIEDEDK